MAQGSSIEWTEATWNPVTGCTIVSPGCAKCYAMRMAARLEAMGQAKYAGTTRKVNGLPVWTGKINLDESALSIPLKRRKPTVWFVNSMSDLFHEGVPFEFVDKVFTVMALTPHHTYQILTKRPERMAEYFARGGVDPNPLIAALALAPKEMNVSETNLNIVGGAWDIPNAWVGCSIESRQYLDRATSVSACLGGVRFWSLEPLLEDLGNIRGYLEQSVEWVIVGGESGPGARPCHVDWIRSIVAQCREKGVPVFVKQVGANPEWGASECWEMTGPPKDPKGGDPSEWPEDLRVREMPNVNQLQREEA